MKAIIHGTTYDFHQYKEDQYVIFDDKIVATGPMEDFVDRGYEITDAKNHLVMPGLVNGHGHIYSTFARGMALPFNPQSFKEILEQLWWRLDKGLTLEDVYYSGVVHSRDALLSGVTTIVDHHASGLISGSLDQLKKAVVEEGGMRGIFCFETSDRFDVDACIKENIDFMTRNVSSVCRGLFGLHASMTLSNQTLEKVGKSIQGKPIHIHVAESIDDQTHAKATYHQKIVERLKAYGLLNPKSILAHCLYIDEQEADLIAESGSRVVLNVSSNMNNSVGLPNHQLLKKWKLPVMIGNDGISAAIVPEWVNILFAMHLKDERPTGFGLDGLHEIIRENYEYISEAFELPIGKIEAGYAADLLMVPYINPTPLNENNALGHLIFGIGGGFKPRHVWCQGLQRVKDYEVSEAHISRYQESVKVAGALWQRLEDGGLNEFKN